MRKTWNKRKKPLISLSLLILALAGAGLFFTAKNPDRTLELIPKDLLDLPYAIFQFSGNSLPEYQLIIDPKDFGQLNDHFGQKTPDDDTFKKRYEPAIFIADGKQYEVDVTYRGDDLSHFINPKKSWRIRFPKNNLFNHKRAINLIIPEDRAFVLEHFNNYRAEKFNLPYPQSQFSTLTINGREQGVYFEIEHWNEEMLEKIQLSPDSNLYGEEDFGDIFTDSSLWQKYVSNPLQDKNDFSELERLLQTLSIESDNVFFKEIEKIVDLENFYAWQVHALLAGSVHQNDDHNVRLYFNRSLGKFQLIVWDVLGNWLNPATIEEVDQLEHNILISRILHNPQFLFKRNKILFNYVSNESNLKDDLAFYNKTYKNIRSELFKDSAKEVSNPYSQKSIWSIRKNIKENFYTLGKLLSAGTTEHSASGNAIKVITHSMSPQIIERISFNLENTPFGPARIFYDTNKNNVLDGQDALLGTFSTDGNKLSLNQVNFALTSTIGKRDATQVELSKTRHVPFFSIVEDTEHNFFVDGIGANQINNLEIQSFNVFSSAIPQEKRDTGMVAAQNLFKNLSPNPEKQAELASFLRSHRNFIKTNPSQLTLPAGNHLFSGVTTLPVGINLEIKPGTRLSFARGASLIVNGAISAIGTPQAPITFTAQNASQKWGVLAVINAKEKSIFENTIFEHGGEHLGKNGLYASGMLSLYSSDAKIRNSSFSSASGDDALNIKRANAEITASIFANNQSDAMDLDFVTGTIENNRIEGNGNDGIDLSGSQVLIYKNTILDSGDKGISVGEKSEVTIKENIINNGNFGIAVKDSSLALIENNEVKGNNIGLAAYQKKLIFSGGVVNVKKTSFKDNKDPKDIDNLSSVK